ncbi:MAG: hypothetical protein AB1938_27010, partial [Myxococcota bacterium]
MQHPEDFVARTCSFRWLVVTLLLSALGCLDNLAGTKCNPNGLCGDGYLCDVATNRCVTECTGTQVACEGTCAESCGAGGGVGGGGA